MRLKHQRPSTPAPKYNIHTESIISVEFLPVKDQFATQHLPSLSWCKQKCADIKKPVLSERISVPSSAPICRRQRVLRSMSTFSEIKEIPRLPELSKLSVSDHTDKEESMSHSLKTTDSHLTSIVVKTEGIQRCCSYPAPSQTRQRSIWASEASLLERLPSLSNCRKSVSTLQTRRKEAIREYVENPQRNFDVGASKAMMFDKWIRSQQESC